MVGPGSCPDLQSVGIFFNLTWKGIISFIIKLFRYLNPYSPLTLICFEWIFDLEPRFDSWSTLVPQPFSIRVFVVSTN